MTKWFLIFAIVFASLCAVAQQQAASVPLTAEPSTLAPAADKADAVTQADSKMQAATTAQKQSQGQKDWQVKIGQQMQAMTEYQKAVQDACPRLYRLRKSDMMCVTCPKPYHLKESDMSCVLPATTVE